MTEAVVVAHPNIALSKYWGKREGKGNYPAVPSLSVTLDGMATTTRVRFDASLADDRVVIGGAEQTGGARDRIVALFDRVRAMAGEARRASLESTNDFPTASGLASSASGFAAAALATVRAAGLDSDARTVSDLARRCSASAARSVFGGFVELAAGPLRPTSDEILAAEPVAPASHLDLRVVVCVTSEAAKSVGSTDGMKRTASASPYFAAWLDEAPRIHARLRDALLARDFAIVGELSEASALAMHASAMAAGVVYFTGATLAALSAVRGLLSDGIAAYATVDAGPHVKVLTQARDEERVERAMREVPGVLRTLRTRPGDGARVLHESEAR